MTVELMCAEYVMYETVKECNKSSFLPHYRIIYMVRNIKEADSSKSETKILMGRCREKLPFNSRYYAVR